MRRIEQLRALSQQVAGQVSRRQEAPFVEVNSAGGGAVDSGAVKTVKVLSISALTFECVAVDLETGEETGDPFTVYPWVVDESGRAATYDLTAETGDVVAGIPSVGKPLRIYSNQRRFWLGDGEEVEPRWWTADWFPLTCPPPDSPPP